MIEVLITIAIVVIGVVGLLQIQSRLQESEVEAYQRSQALMLLNDMADRLSTNRVNADAYVTTGLATPYLGVGGEDSVCDSADASVVAIDLREWCEQLRGAAETSGGTAVGGMIGARGCVQPVGIGAFMVTVAWQGLTPVAAPPASVSCAVGLYNQPSPSPCVNDECRRYVTTMVRLANLEST
ncbi:pilus assembly protein [Mangrovimicrobium sediminis]|uniref:Pilus assembly protein n=2 Tax=Mangrovimicrobium sediminis TaxID=2562682 RepID=A0A4Z0LWV8_9GAMM|nr:pilus assembly protein [Haliea sp. SAOS-164]